MAKNTLLFIGFLLLCLTASAQTEAELQRRQQLRNIIERQEALEMLDENTKQDLFYIPEGQYSALTNDIKEGYYRKEKLYQRIKNLEENPQGSGTYMRQLDTLLENYILNFRIDNFHRDADMIWKAARVKELRGKKQEAIYLYQLAELHIHDTVRKPRLALDSLLAGERSPWLPIDEYYRLLEIRQEVDPFFPATPAPPSPHNLGLSINSGSADYAPFMHPTDSVLIFTSRRDTSGMLPEDVVDPFSQHNEDLYYSFKNIYDGGWEEAIRLSDSINSEYNEGSACLAPDGKTLFFTRCHPLQGMGDCDIYIADYDAATGVWSNVRNLGKAINSEAWDSQPNISSDGKTLLFVSNRNGGFGGTDIYMSTQEEDGSWSYAQNLGPLINTAQHEVTPFQHEINNTLYFSSTGHLPNAGGYDIFKASRMGRGWKKPKNLHEPVNSDKNEYYFSIESMGRTIYYSKNVDDAGIDHVQQNFDLYSLPMPSNARPDADVTLKGLLVDSVTGNLLQGVAMIIPLDDSLSEGSGKIIGENGYFEFDLVNNQRYRIFILGDNFLTIEEDFKLRGDTTFSVLTESFNNKKSFIFESLNFSTRSARLKPASKPKLDYMVRFLKRYPQFKLEIEGHTDSDGGQEMNKELSQKRADAIRSYILKKGAQLEQNDEQKVFLATRIKAIGYGMEKPIVPNSTPENKAINRRVEFKLKFDEHYKGKKNNPTQKEMTFDNAGEVEFEEEFEDDFEFTEEERRAYEQELNLETEEELAEELEEEILKSLKRKKKKKKNN
ncbi:MAG: OmpA family protein [Bacteroidota bacterium]